MDEWDNLGDNLFCHLKSMESWVKEENHNPLKRLQSTYSSKFTKEGFNVQDGVVLSTEVGYSLWSTVRLSVL